MVLIDRLGHHLADGQRERCDQQECQRGWDGGQVEDQARAKGGDRDGAEVCSHQAGTEHTRGLLQHLQCDDRAAAPSLSI